MKGKSCLSRAKSCVSLLVLHVFRKKPLARSISLYCCTCTFSILIMLGCSVNVRVAGHAAVRRAAVAGEHPSNGPTAPGLDAAISNENGPWRARADGPHDLQTAHARYSHSCHPIITALLGRAVVRC